MIETFPDHTHLLLLFSLPKEYLIEIDVQFAKWFQRKRCLKMLRLKIDVSDTGITGILLAHPSAFGSGELKCFADITVILLKSFAELTVNLA